MAGWTARTGSGTRNRTAFPCSRQPWSGLGNASAGSDFSNAAAVVVVPSAAAAAVVVVAAAAVDPADSRLPRQRDDDGGGGDAVDECRRQLPLHSPNGAAEVAAPYRLDPGRHSRAVLLAPWRSRFGAELGRGRRRHCCHWCRRAAGSQPPGPGVATV